MAEQVKPIPKGNALVRTSKYRHVFGTAGQNSDQIKGLKVGACQTESNVLKANPQFVAVPWGVSGCVGVAPLDFKGALAPEHPLIIHDETTVNDLTFNPFNNHMLVTACNDGVAAIWKIPEGGLTESMSTPAHTIKASDKRLLSVDFHPLAENVLITFDAGKQIKFFDVNSGDEKLALPDVHKQLVTNLSWNQDGSQVASSCKDKTLRIFDPRANSCVAETADLQGAKGGRVQWFHKRNAIFTCGFGKGSERQYALYDPRNLSQRLLLETIDNTSSSLMPFFDQDTGVLFLAGKGDGNIRYYEVVDDAPHIYFINEFKTGVPQAGMSSLPKLSCDIRKNEIMRLLKLTPQGVVIPIRFEVPRQSDLFQDDLFPDTWDCKPTMSSDDWFAGANNAPNTVSLNFEN